MIAPDANLLIYAYTPGSPYHAASLAWWEAALSGEEPVGIPLLSIYAFLRIVTNPNLPRGSVGIETALAAVDSWVALSHVRLLVPAERHWILLRNLANQVSLRGTQVNDATIAAVAIEYGATIYTNDRDFARFPGLRWTNPLQL
jgi:toxin-antitoxin system PIN domain toxin